MPMLTKNFILVLGIIAALAFFAFRIFNRQKEAGKHIERTFAIIKPEAVAAGNAPAILNLIKDKGFTILAEKETSFDQAAAEKFYAVHKDKPFFADLVKYITSGPVIVLVLEKENAVKAWRDLMGATNPEKAEAGTIRKLFGKDIQQNAVHGSDSAENAKVEIVQFFPELS